MLRFIENISVDFFRRIFPKKSRSMDFAFIVHPRDYNDVVSNLGFLKLFPKRLVYQFFSKLPAFTVSKITGLRSLRDNTMLDGWVIGMPMFAHEIMENRSKAQRKINSAIKLAKKRGAKVVGLGALTGSVMEGGAGTANKDGTVVTAGRAYTAKAIEMYTEDVIHKLGLDKSNLTIAIVGAAGGVGSAIMHYFLAEPFSKLILIDLERKLDYIKGLKNLKPHVEITHQISAVREADIIVTVTNAPEAVIESKDIKSGAVIIDDAQPSDISPEIIKNRLDVIVIEAGAICTDFNIRIGTNLRLANKNEIYCCLGEVMAIAAGEWKGQYEPKKINPLIIEEISCIAKQLGFKIAPYQVFGRVLDPNRIEEIKKIRTENNIKINV